MTIQVFQADTFHLLAPYAFEREQITRYGAEFVVADCLTDDELIAQAGNAEIILLAWRGVVTPRAMDALPRLRLIVRWGVGFDQIDAVAATQRGIAVANAPSYASEEVAEQAIALMMAAGRRVAWFHDRMRRDEWPSAQTNKIHRIKGRTLALIGAGRIAAATGWRARGLGMNVIAYDRYLSAEAIQHLGFEPVSFEDALSRGDYVSVHVPLNPETRHLIDAQALARMQPGAFLINTSRGGVIDQAALTDALAHGRIAGAGLDVYETEPLPAGDPMRRLEHVTLTPHMAAYSEESWHGLRVEMCDTVRQWIEGSWATSVVNPQVRSRLRPRQG
ncbi:MAG: C-terminal binding protein [Thermoflexales bacterium]|nr:C-terminal binding protein [Thermoflexales bacterium]